MATTKATKQGEKTMETTTMGISEHTIADRLSELTTANIGGEHVSGGDSLLPKRLQGCTIDISRIPTVAEVRACVHQVVVGDDDAEDLDAAICCAAQSIWYEEADLAEWPYAAIDDVCFSIDDGKGDERTRR